MCSLAVATATGRRISSRNWAVSSVQVIAAEGIIITRGYLFMTLGINRLAR